MTKCWLAVIVTFLPFMAVAHYDSSLGACSSTNHYDYGDTGPDGGIVFYLEGACSGMEAQPYDVGVRLIWDDAISASAAYNNTVITKAISCPTTTQPTTPLCWHLPTLTELNYLYDQKSVLGYFANKVAYWSSTDVNANSAWAQYFDNEGWQCECFWKNYIHPVRAVRAF
jgi:hypothetical protein